MFSVTDTGIGIAPENLAVIFGAFQQGDGTLSRRYGGTGLGLSIASEVSSLLGGTISATSDLGHGSTFILSVPAMLPDIALSLPLPETAFTLPDTIGGPDDPLSLRARGARRLAGDPRHRPLARRDHAGRPADQRGAAPSRAAAATPAGTAAPASRPRRPGITAARARPARPGTGRSWYTSPRAVGC